MARFATISLLAAGPLISVAAWGRVMFTVYLEAHQGPDAAFNRCLEILPAHPVSPPGLDECLALEQQRSPFEIALVDTLMTGVGLGIGAMGHLLARKTRPDLLRAARSPGIWRGLFLVISANGPLWLILLTASWPRSSGAALVLALHVLLLVLFGWRWFSTWHQRLSPRVWRRFWGTLPLRVLYYAGLIICLAGLMAAFVFAVGGYPDVSILFLVSFGSFFGPVALLTLFFGLLLHGVRDKSDPELNEAWRSSF